MAGAAVSDPQRVVPLAEKALKALNPDANNESREITLAAAHLRSGNTDEALRRLVHVTEAYENGGTVDCWLLLAIAHAERGNAEQAAQWLQKSRQSLDHQPAEFTALPWHERLQIDLWRREAESRMIQPR